MSQQSRLVLIVDGLDSCEQDKVLLVLDAIQALFSDNGYPFVVILAIDPHIIAKVRPSCFFFFFLYFAKLLIIVRMYEY